jgi:predicted DNA-binding protein YlxM (UPF0122 family)
MKEKAQADVKNNTAREEIIVRSAGFVAETRMSMLYDYYGGLLGERRRQVIALYHEEDLSLAEIAELTGITRQGVHDALKKAEAQLALYESKLGLIERHEAWLAAIEEIDPKIARMLEERVDI